MSEHPLDVLREALMRERREVVRLVGQMVPEKRAAYLARSDADLAALRAVEQLEQRTRECRDSMRAERVDVLMANGPIFLDMLDEGLALFDRKEQTP